MSEELSDQTPEERGEVAGDEAPKKKKRRRRRRSEKPAGSADTAVAEAEGGEIADGGEEKPKRKKKKRSRRRDGDSKEGGAKKGRGRERSFDDDEDLDDPEDRDHTLRTVKPISQEAREQVFDTGVTFRDMGLDEKILKSLDAAGWDNPTKIQSTLIPVALEGRDIFGQAKTGSGKTASFGLPVLHLAEKGVPFQALILGPTRELAIQIRDDLLSLGKHTGLNVVAVYGGQKIHTQAAKLDRGPEIIVGTPGRVQDMHRRGHLPLDNVRFAVLDEVDRMFDIGFRDDIKRILGFCPKKKQTIFVSATINDEIERLAKKHMDRPKRLIVTSGSLTVEMVKQRHIPVNPWDKQRMLAHVLTHEEPDLTIVFCRMKRTVDKVAQYLDKKGIPAMPLHGDLSQGARNKVMKEFRHGELGVLIASDLAARGLDVDGISHVVNYDLPEDPDLYVHRIGRTARAGREGVAWSLVTPEQGGNLTDIENLINAEIPKLEYPDFEARAEPPKDWKPEPKPGFQPVVVEGVEEARNRLDDDPDLPADSKLSDAELAAKFPGGVVPKALPKRRIRGKLRTTRGK